MIAIETRRFADLDQLLDMNERDGMSIVKMADGSTGMHAIFEPGWTWEADETPLLGSPDSCPMRHTGYCISGKLIVRMIDTRIEMRISTGDFFEIPRCIMAMSRAEMVELNLFAAPEHQH